MSENGAELKDGVAEASKAGDSAAVQLKRDELMDEAAAAGESLAETAEEAKRYRKKAAVTTGLSNTTQPAELGIAADVLEKLLPDEGIVVLPRIHHVSGGVFYRALKRAFDIASCGIALVILVIPMAMVAARIKAESPGPAIYAQSRVGKGGKVFKLYKFRSMYTDAEMRGARWAAEGDLRVTPFGRKIRRTRVDELPQFWNVVKGDMSLIGPRPERPAFHEEFSRRIDGWEQRLLVKPGITGLAQVMGGYDLLPKEKALYDIEYIETRSVDLDWRIILKTIQTIFSGEGSR